MRKNVKKVHYEQTKNKLHRKIVKCVKAVGQLYAYISVTLGGYQIIKLVSCHAVRHL